MADFPSKRIRVTTENGFCDGHFPGHSIVPAAVQVQWIVALAQEHFPERAQWNLRQIKLLRELAPGAEVDITLEPTKRGLRGRVADANGPYAELLIAHD